MKDYKLFILVANTWTGLVAWRYEVILPGWNAIGHSAFRLDDVNLSNGTTGVSMLEPGWTNFGCGIECESSLLLFFNIC